MTQVILYTSEDGKSQIQLRADGGTVWLSQLEMAELFQTSKQNVAKHLKAVFSDQELSEESVVNHWMTTAADGKNYRVAHYNLDAILAVGYRVRSPRGVQFRRWASTVLKEYLLKGFAMDDERLKNPDGRPDYFDEMLARIRDIRASEKRFYQKVRDLFALSSDYDKTDATTQQFFATVQNLLLYAVTQQTAAELILARANAADPHFGLLTWKGAQVRKHDIVVAKKKLPDRGGNRHAESAGDDLPGNRRVARQAADPDSHGLLAGERGADHYRQRLSLAERRGFGQPCPHGAEGRHAVSGLRPTPQDPGGAGRRCAGRGGTAGSGKQDQAPHRQVILTDLEKRKSGATKRMDFSRPVKSFHVRPRPGWSGSRVATADFSEGWIVDRGDHSEALAGATAVCPRRSLDSRKVDVQRAG